MCWYEDWMRSCGKIMQNWMPNKNNCVWLHFPADSRRRLLPQPICSMEIPSAEKEEKTTFAYFTIEDMGEIRAAQTRDQIISQLIDFIESG